MWMRVCCNKLYLIFLDIEMKLFKTEKHADVAYTLNNMATIYFGLGQKDKALEMYQKVLSK